MVSVPLDDHGARAYIPPMAITPNTEGRDMNRKPQIFWDDHRDGEAPTRAQVGIIGRNFGTIVKADDGWQAWTPARMSFTGPITPGECIGTYSDHLDAARALADEVAA